MIKPDTFFFNGCQPMIVETVGPDIECRQHNCCLISPTDGSYSFEDAKYRTIDYIHANCQLVIPIHPMFDAATSHCDVLANYNPNADYYCYSYRWQKTVGADGVVYSFSGMLNPNAESFTKLAFSR
jgi:hypothetical protein